VRIVGTNRILRSIWRRKATQLSIAATACGCVAQGTLSFAQQVNSWFGPSCPERV
jgi:hypothetical protein